MVCRSAASHPAREKLCPELFHMKRLQWSGCLQRDARQKRKADTVSRTKEAKRGRNRVTEEPGASRAREKGSLKLWGYSYCQTHKPEAKREWGRSTLAFLGSHTLSSCCPAGAGHWQNPKGTRRSWEVVRSSQISDHLKVDPIGFFIGCGEWRKEKYQDDISGFGLSYWLNRASYWDEGGWGRSRSWKLSVWPWTCLVWEAWHTRGDD